MTKMLNFLKTWPFGVIEIKSDKLTSVILRSLAIEQPQFKGPYLIYGQWPSVRQDGPLWVYVEGNGVVSGIFTADGCINLSCF